MTPQDFIRKWKANARAERAAAQEHFIDLCRLLDEADGRPGAKTRELDEAPRSRHQVEAWRRRWADLANEALRQAGVAEQIDHRSHRRQAEADGLPEVLPQVKEGPRASARRPMDWPVRARRINAARAALNAPVRDLPVGLLDQHYANRRMGLEVGNHLAEGCAAGLLGGLHVHVFLFHREALRRGVFLQQLQLRRDREAFLLLLLGGDAGIDHRLFAGGIGDGCGLRCLGRVV